MANRIAVSADEGISLFSSVKENFAQGKNGVNALFHTIYPDDMAAVAGGEQIKRMNALANAIMALNADVTCYFYSYSVTFDFKEERARHEQMRAETQGYLAKLNEISKTTYEELSRDSGDVRRKVYLFALSGAMPRQSLELLFEKVNRSLIEARMTARKSRSSEVIDLFNRLLLVPHENTEPRIDKTSYFFKPTTIEVQNHGHKNVAQVIGILQMPRFPIGPFWLTDLFEVNDVVTCMQIETLEEKKQNSFVESLISDFVTLRKSRSRIRNEQNENVRDAIEAIASDISRGLQQAKLVKIMVLAHERNAAALKLRMRQVKRVIERMGCSYNNINFRQLQALRTLQPFWHQEIEKDVEVTLQTDAIGLSYPFTQTSYIDPGGSFIGMSAGQTPIIFNQCDRRRAQNGNMVILGTSGSRKSTLMKVTLLGGLTNPQIERMLVVDWENEYTALADNFEQTVIRFTRSGGKDSPTLNIFEIPRDPSQNVKGIEPVSLRERYVSQVQYLIGLLPIFLTRAGARLSSDEIAVLETSIKRTYEALRINDASPVEHLRSADWPTLDDLYAEITQMAKGTKETTGVRHNAERLSRLMEQYVSGGVYDGLFNRKTNIDLSKTRKLVVFNLHGLFAVDSPAELKTSMMMSVLRFLSSTMIDHRRKYPREGDPDAKFITFVLDEFHVLVNEDYPQGLSLLAGLYAQVRKYYCQVSIATQSLVTFTRSSSETIKRYTQSILDNANYKVILSMTEQALADVNDKLFAGSANSLTSAETDYLSRGSNGDPGRFLLMAGSEQRVSGRVWSGKNLTNEQMHRPLSEITDLVQLWQPKVKK